MNNSITSEIENEMLSNMGIDPIKCNDYQILCLPENFHQGSKDNLYDADYTSNLCKILKSNGVKCANSYNLGIDSKIYVRKSDDVYLGLVWILSNIALPIFTNVMYDYFKEKMGNKNIIHVEIRLPNGKVFKHAGDAETLKERLEEEFKQYEE